MNSTETIFDDVFKTICERMPDLLVPVINEAFGTDYPLDIKIVKLDKELQLGDRMLIYSSQTGDITSSARAQTTSA